MRLPRQISGDELAHALRVLGYAITRQSGSHLRLTTMEPREHHITIPRHNPLKVGTLSALLADLASFHATNRDKLINLLFEV